MGNRGVLLTKQNKPRLFTSEKRWIICELEFKGRKRPLMQPGRYTELFFFDEATALAAGHRPCFECRRHSAKEFKDLAGFKTFPELDSQLHTERTHPQLYTEDWISLPDGAMIACQGAAYLVCKGQLYQWSFDGYRSTDPQNLTNQSLTLLTPATTIQVMRKGYQVKIGSFIS